MFTRVLGGVAKAAASLGVELGARLNIYMKAETVTCCFHFFAVYRRGEVVSYLRRGVGAEYWLRHKKRK